MNYLESLLRDIPWRHDEAIMFGKHIVTARQDRVVWRRELFLHHTPDTIMSRLKWTESLLAIKAVVEEIAGYTYNSCLLNLYLDGTQGMGWHHDDEKGLGKNANIASVSLRSRTPLRLPPQTKPRESFRHARTRQPSHHARAPPKAIGSTRSQKAKRSPRPVLTSPSAACFTTHERLRPHRPSHRVHQFELR